jgi:hypothetical protein
MRLVLVMDFYLFEWHYLDHTARFCFHSITSRNIETWFKMSFWENNDSKNKIFDFRMNFHK